ncbi:MAG TPA: adenine deaminase [Flavihumibacter sp.]
MEKIIQGNLVDLFARSIYHAELHISGDRIRSIRRLSDIPNTAANFICPGFVDAHVHIESSLLVPSAFAQLAVAHGTVATISDPHEIANVCGVEGVDFMIANGKQVPFKFHFGAPSCVPATSFETAGATLDAEAVRKLLERDDIFYLSEMMNFPGVLHADPEVMAKIAAAKALNKPVDGHAPGLRGDAAATYAAAGIQTDHECVSHDEGAEKIALGMKILIREGSAARNFDALIELLRSHPGSIMFCSDDKHPDSLVEGYINRLCARAVALEIDVFDVLRAACVHPVLHYNMQVGLLREGDFADFVILKDLERFDVISTFINGQAVFADGKSMIPSVDVVPINQFNCEPIDEESLKVSPQRALLPAIECYDGQLITGSVAVKPGDLQNPDNDLLKIAVINRYHPAPVATAYIKGFGLKKGAIASSVAHDSHNIIAVGADDTSIVRAVNLVIRDKGGLSCVDGNTSMVLPLPVAGLMSADDGQKVADAYTAIDRMAKSLGSPLNAPFMTLSFMALLVIPAVKLSDRGLFDGQNFRFF